MSRKIKNKRLEIRLAEDLKEKIDILVAKLCFKTRTDLIIYLILKEYDRS